MRSLACFQTHPHNNFSPSNSLNPPTIFKELFMILKKILLSLGLISGLMLSGKSSAQQAPQGPFSDYNQLISAWQQFDVSGAGFVYIDNVLVFQREGFGPAASGYYYDCAAEGLIRSTPCPENGPFRSISAIKTYWSRWAAATTTATYIFVNNQQVYSFPDGFGPAFSKNYVYCANRGAYMVNCSR
jgi:hypothetical protein